jgi:hypothetical protein
VARKRLIKGANATRVEERIARVPADVMGALQGQSIFGALRAMEEGDSREPSSEAGTTAGAEAPRPDKKAESRKPAARRRATRKPEAAKAPPIIEHREAAEGGRAEKAEPSGAADRPAKRSRIGPSDFSAAERAEIVRCCSDYRNRLPTYLLAVQLEVEVIDSVIDKCRGTMGDAKK